MDGVKKKINFDPALLYFSNKTDEEKPKPIPIIPTTETYNSTNRKHSCSICGKRFFTVSSLNAHTEHHTLNAPNNTSCEDDKSRKDRQSSKKGSQFACNRSECNFVALDVVESQEHLIVCEGKRFTRENAPAFCDSCKSSFTSANHLKAHAVLTHSETYSEISLDECSVKQIISDPVCLYVSENTDGDSSSKNPTMYPGPDHSSFSKKKCRESDIHNQSTVVEKKKFIQDEINRQNEIAGDNLIFDSNGDIPIIISIENENGGCDSFYTVNSVEDADSSSKDFNAKKCALVVEKLDNPTIITSTSHQKSASRNITSVKMMNSYVNSLEALEKSSLVNTSANPDAEEHTSNEQGNSHFLVVSENLERVSDKNDASRVTMHKSQHGNPNREFETKLVGPHKEYDSPREQSQQNVLTKTAENRKRSTSELKEENAMIERGLSKASQMNSPTAVLEIPNQNHKGRRWRGNIEEDADSQMSSLTELVENPKRNLEETNLVKTVEKNLNIRENSEKNLSPKTNENSKRDLKTTESFGIMEKDRNSRKELQENLSAKTDGNQKQNLKVENTSGNKILSKALDMNSSTEKTRILECEQGEDLNSNIAENAFSLSYNSPTKKIRGRPRKNSQMKQHVYSQKRSLETNAIQTPNSSKNVQNVTENSFESSPIKVDPILEGNQDSTSEEDSPLLLTNTLKNVRVSKSIDISKTHFDSVEPVDSSVNSYTFSALSSEMKPTTLPSENQVSSLEKVTFAENKTIVCSDDKNAQKKKKKKKKKKKNTSIFDLPLETNMKQRSIRSRKKLILPDFEYGFDGKLEKEEFSGPMVISTPKNHNVLEKGTLKCDTSSNTVDNAVRKRGRPRKSLENYSVPRTSCTSTAMLSVIDIDEEKTVKTVKSSPEENSTADTGDEAAIFSLTTSMSEPEPDLAVNLKMQEDFKNDTDESWLKKLDFSEGQSLIDSWNEQPQNRERAPKRGRPPKRKKVTEGSIAPKKSEERDGKTHQSSQENQKKRGRPKKHITTLDDNETRSDTCIEDNVCNHAVAAKKLMSDDVGETAERPLKNPVHIVSNDIDEINETSNCKISETKRLDAILAAVVTIKKRGRPSKQKVNTAQTASPDTSSESVAYGNSPLTAIEAENGGQLDVSNCKKSTLCESNGRDSPQTTEAGPKKRGRPRKSLLVDGSENTKSAAKIDVSDNHDDEGPKKGVEASIEDTNMKKRREFMEYMRIKEDVDDAEYESGRRVEGTSQSISPLKKRGRPRLDEVARKRAAAAESLKNERPYSIYNKYNAASEGFLKRRRNPLPTFDLLKIKRNRKRKLLDDAKKSDVMSPSGSVNDSSVAMSDSSLVDDGATLDKDDSPFLVKKSAVSRPKKLIKIKTKKSARDASPQFPDGDDDETKNIDPDLYLADVRNRAKYSRVFKKVREVPKHEEYFPDSLVTCGRCKKLMTLRHYHLYHQISHYFLSWLDGEKELDFSVDTELIKIMQLYVNPDALRKKLIKLHCDQCHKIMKSVVGYVSHIRFCSKINEEELLHSCVLCGKKLKPSSLRHHYVKTHNISLPNVNAKTKDELFVPASESSLKSDATTSYTTSSSTKKPQRSYLNFERKNVDKSDIINDEDFWTSLRTSYDLFMCMGLSCKYMTLSKDDLKNHILNCHAAFCEFKCLVCSFTTRYESEIIYHTKNACKDSSDIEEKADDELDTAATIVGRRVSNRVKKRKCRYEDEFFEDGERKKTKVEDEDFQLSDEAEEDDQDFLFDSDEDVVHVKSRSRKSGLFTAHGSDPSLRVAFLNHTTTRQYDPLTWTIETRQKIFNQTPILDELKVNSTLWGLTSLTNLPLHAPKQIKSMKIASDSNKFIDYELFQSDVVKGVPISFVGGPVWALAWAPLPAHISEQYLAVAGLPHMNHLIELHSSVGFPSLIQIWKYNSLDNISNTIDKPTLDLAIAHQFGAVSCMEWCPSGGFDNRSSTCRLGVLAVATSAGCVVVYSVPKLDSANEASNQVAFPEPDLILCVTCDNVQCTRVVWLRKKEQGVICGGFSNGTIALWNISTKSSLLRNGNKIYPYRTFEAHNASILALDAHWLDNGRYLLTSSIDRVMKYWDLEDLSGPLNEQEGSSPIVNVVWLQQWAVSAVGFDSSNLVDASAILSHSRDTVEKKKSIANVRDTCWSIAYSDWNDTVALSLCSGQVSVFAAKHMSVLSFKQPDFEKVVTETSLVPLNDEDKELLEECVEKRTGLPETKTSYDCTSLLQEFGLQFCDRVKNKTPSTKSGFTPDCCNVMSINKVCWNQNFNSFNWLAVGYESGFIRIFRVERFDKLHLTKFYKMNETCNACSV